MTLSDKTTRHKSVEAEKNNAARYLIKGEFRLAKQIFEKLVENDSQDVTALIGLGEALEGVGKVERAILAFKSAVSLSPRAFDPLRHLGRIYLDQHRYKKALQFLSRATDVNPASDMTLVDLGVAYRSFDDPGAAIECFRKATELNPNSIAAHYNLAASLRENGEPESAVEILNSILEKNPSSIDVRVLAASILSDLNEMDQAIALLNDYLKIHPESAECRQNISLIQLRAGRLGDGFDNYEWRLTPNAASVSVRPFSQSVWRGEPLVNERLLLWLEQGVGDEILSLSLLEQIIERAPNCIVECDPRLLVAKSCKIN